MGENNVINAWKLIVAGLKRYYHTFTAGQVSVRSKYTLSTAEINTSTYTIMEIFIWSLNCIKFLHCHLKWTQHLHFKKRILCHSIFTTFNLKDSQFEVNDMSLQNIKIYLFYRSRKLGLVAKTFGTKLLEKILGSKNMYKHWVSNLGNHTVIHTK